MPRFKDQAICIRHIDWSETSQVVALLTREQGKVRGIAKGSKRTSPGSVQRFSGGIELLTRGQVVATTKATTDLASISEWDLQQPYRHLRTDLEANQIGMYAVDLVAALMADHDPHPDSFDAMVQLLESLTVPDDQQRQFALLQFQWALLFDCGFKPELDADASTGEVFASGGDADQPLWFDAHAGGVTYVVRDSDFTHARGRGADPGPWRVRLETVTLLRSLSNGHVIDKVDADSIVRANRLLCVYIRALLDRQLPTMAAVLG